MPEAPAQGPLTAAVSYTANQAQAAYAYGKENISVVNYVASKVEVPASKVLSTVEPYSTSAVSFFDGCLVKTHAVVIEKPTTLATATYTGAVKNIDTGIVQPTSAAYTGAVKQIDATIDHYLPGTDPKANDPFINGIPSASPMPVRSGLPSVHCDLDYNWMRAASLLLCTLLFAVGRTSH